MISDFLLGCKHVSHQVEQKEKKAILLNPVESGAGGSIIPIYEFFCCDNFANYTFI